MKQEELDRLLAEMTDSDESDFSEGDWYDEEEELHAETVKVHGVCSTLVPF